MMMIPPAATKKDLSDIDNLEDLKAEISNLSKSIKTQEAELTQRLNRLPAESMKATVGAVIPSVASKLITGKSIGIATSVLGFILGKRNFNKVASKQNVSGVAKSIGLVAAIKGVQALLKRRKQPVKNEAE